jgi:hypothetical protein
MEEVMHPIEEIMVPAPPDYIFEYPRNRAVPSQDIWENGQNTFIPDHVEYAEGKGTLMYYKGIALPDQGLKLDGGLYAIAPIKRTIVSRLKEEISRAKNAPLSTLGILLISKRRRASFLEQVLTGFNDSADQTALPFYLRPEYYCPPARAVRMFVSVFLASLGVSDGTADHTGKILATIVEYDCAYRLRLQDLMSETSKAEMYNYFPVERLMRLENEREYKGELPQRFKAVGKISSYLWYVPSFRRAVREGLGVVEFKDWQLTEGDIYHTLMYYSYNVRGLSLGQRHALWLSIYPNGDFPQIVNIRPLKKVE